MSETISGYVCHVNTYHERRVNLTVVPNNDDEKPSDIAYAVFRAIAQREGMRDTFMDISVETKRHRDTYRETTTFVDFEARWGHIARKTSAANRKWYPVDGKVLTNQEFAELSQRRANERRQAEEDQRNAAKAEKERKVNDWRKDLAQRLIGMSQEQLANAIRSIAAECDEPHAIKWLEDKLAAGGN